MTIEKIFAHLVYPNYKGDQPIPFTSSEVSLSGKLFSMIKEIYEGSPAECNIEISFRSNNQTNIVRDALVDLIKKRTAVEAGVLAERLASKTTMRSKSGLFFVVIGKAQSKDCVLFSRFPTDKAILADDGSGSLNVEFLEKFL